MGKIDEAAKRAALIAALPEAERAEILAIQARTAAALADRGEQPRYGRGLKEPRFDVVDTGSRMGDPEHGAKRRADAIDGAYERGTVKIKVRGADGKLPRKGTDVPATLENLRIALEQARKGTPRKPESIKAKAELCASLLRRIRAAEAGKGALDGTPATVDPSGVRCADMACRRGHTDERVHVLIKAGAPGQRDHGMMDGIALVKGRDMTGVKPVGRGKNDKPRNGTMAGKLGAERNDRVAVHGPVDKSQHEPGAGDPCTVSKCKRTHVKGRLHGKKLCAENACDHVAGGKYAPTGTRDDGSPMARTYAQLNAMGRAARGRYFKVTSSNKRKAERAAAYGTAVNPVTGRAYNERHRHGELAGAARVTGERGDESPASEAELIMRKRPHM